MGWPERGSMDGYEATSLLRRKGYIGPIIALASPSTSLAAIAGRRLRLTATHGIAAGQILPALRGRHADAGRSRPPPSQCPRVMSHEVRAIRHGR